MAAAAAATAEPGDFGLLEGCSAEGSRCLLSRPATLPSRCMDGPEPAVAPLPDAFACAGCCDAPLHMPQDCGLRRLLQVIA